MNIERFFDLFLDEIKLNPALQKYYKFSDSDKLFNFRKAYFIQRLEFVQQNIENQINTKIWDCGCGYGTTCLFLAMNGVKTTGTTLEFYYKEIENRKKYWSKYGNSSFFEAVYENIFDTKFVDNQFDIIIAQDTLHHLEPFEEASKILARKLKPDGKIIAVEENGKNIIQNLKLFKQRGFKKVIKIHDPILNTSFLLGNENIRSVKKWDQLFSDTGLILDYSTLKFIRYFMPGKAQKYPSFKELIDSEQNIKSSFKRNYFFFGINFVLRKQIKINQ